MATGVTVEPLGRTHAAQMASINNACPIEADFTLVFERGSDFFRWPELAFEEFRYVGAFEGSRLVGYLMVAFFTGWTGEAYERCGYLGDARLLPEYRGRHLAAQMMHAIEALVPADVAVGFALVKKGNRPAESLADTMRSSAFERRPLGEFHVFNLPVLGAPRLPLGLAVRRASRNDAEPMAALFARANSGKLFAPPYPAAQLAAEISDGSLLCDHWVIEEHGRLAGMLVSWDLHPVHTARVLRYSLSGRLLRTAYNGFARLRPGAALLPPPGNVLRSRTLTRIAIEGPDPAILHALLAHVLRDALGTGCNFLSVGFSDGDPLLEAFRGFPLAQHFPSSLHLITPRSADIGDPARPVYVDLLMI